MQRALRSVKAQTWQVWEALVVDDYSDEDIAEVVAAFRDERMRYIRSTGTPGNANVCRNLGLQAAKGEYIAMLDSDDEWLPEHLETRIRWMESTGADGLFGSVYVDNGSTRRSVISRPLRNGEGMADYLFTNGSAPTPSHFYKTVAAKEIGWDENLLRHQDYDFTIRFAAKYTFLPCDAITVVVHWEAGVKRNQHFPSLLRFVEKHHNEFTPQVIKKYLLARFSECYESGDENSALMFRHYALKQRAAMNRVDYFQLHPTFSGMHKFTGHLRYLLYKIGFF